MSVSCEANTFDDRGDQRAPVAIIATVRRSGRTPFKVDVTNVSCTGCRVESLARMHVGNRVWVTLPGFQAIEGTIRWTNRRSCGVQWEAPIHPAVFVHIHERYPNISAEFE